MKNDKQIHYWAHMLDEAFNKDLVLEQHNSIDKQYFDAIFAGDKKLLRNIFLNYARQKFANSQLGIYCLYHGSADDSIREFTVSKDNLLFCFDNKYAALTYSGETELILLPDCLNVNEELDTVVWNTILTVIPVLMKDGKFIVDFNDDACEQPELSDKYKYNNSNFYNEIKSAYGIENALKMSIKLSELDKSIKFMDYLPQQAKDLYDVQFFVVNVETKELFKDYVQARDSARKYLEGVRHNYQYGGVYPLYAMVTNPFEFDANGGVWNGLEFNGKEYQTTDSIAYWAADKGHDITIIYNVEDNAVNGIEQAGMQDEYIITAKPSLVKSACLITYDDDLRIIPLSKRFNFNVDDIRY